MVLLTLEDVGQVRPTAVNGHQVTDVVLVFPVIVDNWIDLHLEQQASSLRQDLATCLMFLVMKISDIANQSLAPDITSLSIFSIQVTNFNLKMYLIFSDINL